MTSEENQMLQECVSALNDGKIENTPDAEKVQSWANVWGILKQVNLPPGTAKELRDMHRNYVKKVP